MIVTFKTKSLKLMQTSVFLTAVFFIFSAHAGGTPQFQPLNEDERAKLATKISIPLRPTGKKTSCCGSCLEWLLRPPPITIDLSILPDGKIVRAIPQAPSLVDQRYRNNFWTDMEEHITNLRNSVFGQVLCRKNKDLMEQIKTRFLMGTGNVSSDLINEIRKFLTYIFGAKTIQNKTRPHQYKPLLRQFFKDIGEPFEDKKNN